MADSIFTPNRRLWTQRTALVVSALCVVWLSRLLPVGVLLDVVLSRLNVLGIWGDGVFILAYVVGALLFAPGLAMTLTAGALFGVVRGVVLVSIASTVAAAIAFLLGRYVARQRVERWARRHAGFAAFDHALGEGDWRIVALLRLTPLVPYSLANYLFGLMPVRFWPYVVSSWAAMLPATMVYVYLGYTGRVGLTQSVDPRGTLEWLMLIIGLMATVAVTGYVSLLARRAIAARTRDESSQGEPQNVTNTTKRAPGLASVCLTITMAMLLVIATACSDMITARFGPPVIVAREAYADRVNGPTMSHASFNQILAANVDAMGLVDYATLAADTAPLDDYIGQIADAPLERMGRDERLALLINAYNAFTLRLILDHWQDGALQSIKDIPASQRWDAARWNLGGQVVSLSQIEHEQIRPNFIEPCVHFALVCAAIGCPPLRQEAYEAVRIEAQLEDQARRVHSHGRWFRFDPLRNEMALTPLYQWYRGDFLQTLQSKDVVDFAAQYVPDLRRALDRGDQLSRQWLDYDWSLNRQNNQID